MASVSLGSHSWKEWADGVEENIYVWQLRPEFRQNVQKLVVGALFMVLVLASSVLLLYRHSPTILELPEPEQDVLPSPFKSGPRRGDNPSWVAMHDRLVKQAASSTAGILFIGDSITEGWLETQMSEPHDMYSGVRKVWDSMETALGLKLENAGVAGDRVMDVRWRMQNGELPESPSLRGIVLCIGVNDLLSDRDAKSTAVQIKELVGLLRKERPSVQILLLSILPAANGRGELHPGPAAVNAALSKLNMEGVTYGSCDGNFVENGKLRADLFQEDLLHLSVAGYKVWSELLISAIKDLVKRP